MTLYLASASPRRSQILRQAGIRFRLLAHDAIEPEPGPDIGPVEHALANARAKAASASTRIRSGLVIGVDTVVAIGSRTLGKPVNSVHAAQMLSALSGRVHSVATGLAVIRSPDGRLESACETSRVRFRRLTEDDIRCYSDSAEPVDKAGAYAVQGRAAGFIEMIDGSYLNVVGLPLFRLLQLLDRLRPHPARVWSC